MDGGRKRGMRERKRWRQGWNKRTRDGKRGIEITTDTEKEMNRQRREKQGC